MPQLREGGCHAGGGTHSAMTRCNYRRAGLATSSSQELDECRHQAHRLSFTASDPVPARGHPHTQSGSPNCRDLTSVLSTPRGIAAYCPSRQPGHLLVQGSSTLREADHQTSRTSRMWAGRLTDVVLINFTDTNRGHRQGLSCGSASAARGSDAGLWTSYASPTQTR